MSLTSKSVAELSPQEKRALLAQLLRRKAGKSGSFPLSFAQQRLWFLEQMDPGGTSYNVPLAARLSGVLDLAALEKSLNAVVQRQAILRTTFPLGVEGQPVQVVAPNLALTLAVVDLQDIPEGERKTEARRRAVAEARLPFDLTRGPLIRALLLRLNPRDHVLLLNLHHIVSDGWSLGVLLREVMAHYEAFLAGRPPALPELTIQYADYAVWQRRHLQGKVLEEQLGYWKERLAHAPAALDLPADHPRPPVQTFRGAHLPYELSPDLSRALRDLSQQESCTPFMVLLAAFQALLGRYTGQEDICVGSPIAGRTRAETEGLVGFFVNTLVLRADLSGNPSFRQFLQRVRETALGAFAHQDLPFERLVEELQPERDLSRSPLFQVLFVYQNAPLPALEFGGLTLTPWEIDNGTSKFDLSLFVVDRGDRLTGTLEYSTDLYEQDTMARLLGHWPTLLEGILAHPEQALADLPLLTETERWQVLLDFNATQTNYPQVHLLPELIEDQVRRRPEAVALVFEDQQLTYQELNRRANQLAHFLQKQGVGPD
ncbi:MAG: AMP-binding protein, partial [Planctomycetes bacterium]|nr:AMP-binding protein [Planctomycetota bacterium]